MTHPFALSLAGLPAFLAYFGLAIALLLVFGFIYTAPPRTMSSSSFATVTPPLRSLWVARSSRSCCHSRAPSCTRCRSRISWSGA